MWSFLAVICRSQSLVFEKKKRNFFGLLPNTESNSLENALLFLNVNGDIAEKLQWLFMWSFVVVILQKSVSGHWFWGNKKLNFFGLLLNTEGKSLENALLFLNGDRSEKFDY